MHVIPLHVLHVLGHGEHVLLARINLRLSPLPHFRQAVSLHWIQVVNLFLQRTHSVLLEFMTESEEHWHVICERTKFVRAWQFMQEELEQYSQPVVQPNNNRTSAFVFNESVFIFTHHANQPSIIAGFTVSNGGIA
jgi:hypothetical protein